MKVEQIQEFLTFLGVPPRSIHFKREWVVCSCPYAPFKHRGTDAKPSFGIRYEGEGITTPYAHCFSCDSTGSLEELTYELALLNREVLLPRYNLKGAFSYLAGLPVESTPIPIPSWESLEFKSSEAPLYPFPEPWLYNFKKAVDVPLCLDYIHSRGITTETAVALDLRYDYNRHTVCSPFRDFDNTLRGLRGRYISPKGDIRFYDYKVQDHSNIGNMWMGEHHLDTAKPLIVVEGQFDYARIYQMYPNVVAALTASVSVKKLKRLQYFHTIIPFTDNDTAGKTLASKIQDYLLETSVVLPVIYPPDCVAKGWKDPGWDASKGGGMPDSYLKELLELHLKFSL